MNAPFIIDFRDCLQANSTFSQQIRNAQFAKKVVIDLIKFILYSRNQIKQPFDDLVRQYNSYYNSDDDNNNSNSQETMTAIRKKPIPFKLKRYVESIYQLFQSLDQVFIDDGDDDDDDDDENSNDYSRNGSCKKVIAFSLGTSIFNIKELYLFHFPTFKSNDNMNNNINNNSLTREIMKKLIIDQPDVFLNPQRPLKIHLFVYSSLSHFNSNQDHFLPKQGFQIKLLKSTKINIFNFNIDHQNEQDLFDLIKVQDKKLLVNSLPITTKDNSVNIEDIEDMEIDISNSSIDQSHNDHHHNYIWYQYKNIINNFCKKKKKYSFPNTGVFSSKQC
ncbi:hypothetical protein CYY_001460 [Polysphondylium violaceum]|uniref:Uncharacterized protein n=1 Tax=Polysphondylium violaceum TaxID=133409 RepID=A0A8J4UW55_9MYCE|nr:hypothetical protein CYY_001460 [Polysphondylium violaceum]